MQQPDPAARPAVFVLFGATGDLARRMVLPAWYRLACEGLLPRQWMLVGNGRGDITHENFRARVRDALTEFGPKPEGTDWDSFAQRVFFAGGGFSSGNPGSLPDVLGNPRWRDVPFYLRTGKRLAASKQQVSLILREPPGPLAGQLPRDGNVLSFSLAGAGEIDLLLVDKKPGPALDLDVVRAAVPLASLHGADPLPPYVRLIHDVLIGDRSLFTRPDGLAAVWQVAEPLLTSPPPVRGYAPGSWGPAQARELIAPGQWLLGQ